MISNEHFKGSIHSILLFLLSENEELYGYEITQMVKERTNGVISFTEGAIYPALHKLEKKQLIQSRKERINGRMRKYYSITKQGVNETAIHIDSLNQLYNAMVAIFGSKITKPYAAK